MKNYVITLIAISGVGIILGIITQFVGKAFFLGLSANALNDLTQTFLLFAISLGVWDYIKKE